MNHARTLGFSLLASLGLASSAFVAAACGGQIDPSTESQGSGTDTSPTGTSPSGAPPSPSGTGTTPPSGTGTSPPPSQDAGPQDTGVDAYRDTGWGSGGRPLEVRGEARLAPVKRGDARQTNGDATMDDRTRRAIAHAWLEDARMEHASVASFAKFALELMSVGAPMHLVAAAHEAAGDEVRHAALCFDVASRVGGVTHSAGPLALDGVNLTSNLVVLVRAAIREGCVGETVAALVAAAQRDRATDPVARAALDIIARDEARHAELAWRFVKWAVAEGGERVREAARETFERALSRRPQPREDRTDVDPALWSAFGRLTSAEEDLVLRDAYDLALLPCARALTGG